MHTVSVDSRHAFQGVPSFFRACCREASIRRYGFSYDHPGHELMRHMRDSLIPYSIDEDEWEKVVDGFEELLLSDTPESEKAAVDWLLGYYPKCMSLVPSRRRSIFIRGMRSIVEETA